MFCAMLSLDVLPLFVTAPPSIAFVVHQLFLAVGMLSDKYILCLQKLVGFLLCMVEMWLCIHMWCTLYEFSF